MGLKTNYKAQKTHPQTGPEPLALPRGRASPRSCAEVRAEKRRCRCSVIRRSPNKSLMTSSAQSCVQIRPNHFHESNRRATKCKWKVYRLDEPVSTCRGEASLHPHVLRPHFGLPYAFSWRHCTCLLEEPPRTLRKPSGHGSSWAIPLACQRHVAVLLRSGTYKDHQAALLSLNKRFEPSSSSL